MTANHDVARWRWNREKRNGLSGFVWRLYAPGKTLCSISVYESQAPGFDFDYIIYQDNGLTESGSITGGIMYTKRCALEHAQRI